jgi:hypothetical protein
MNKNILRVVAGMALAAALVAGYVASLYFRADKEMSGYDAQDAAMQAYYEKEVAKADAQRALEAQDTYGGKTPQETWQMFVEALKKGDTDLAAKYFMLDRQNEKSEYFSTLKKNGFLESYLNDYAEFASSAYTDDKKEFSFYTKPVEVDIRGKKMQIPLNITLRISEVSGLWKMYEP